MIPLLCCDVMFCDVMCIVPVEDILMLMLFVRSGLISLPDEITARPMQPRYIIEEYSKTDGVHPWGPKGVGFIGGILYRCGC